MIFVVKTQASWFIITILYLTSAKYFKCRSFECSIPVVVGHIFQLRDRVTSQTSFPMMRFPVDENALGLERIYQITKLNGTVKPIFHLATLFA